ncbi:MAG: winged helix-turn-helix domain-containing protein [Acidobacteria bacterium]|nr:winged helix-turn-helix domain-containing protein [Acidobacteriota bacterium]
MSKLNDRKIYEFEDFRLDTAHLLLYRNEREISLAPKAVQTLLALIEHRGEVLGKDELMEMIWTDSIVEESNLSQYLHVLRKTLGETADGKPMIETLRRRGYRFNGDVRCVLVSEKQSAEEILIQTQPEVETFGQHRLNVERKGNILAPANWQSEREAKVGENISMPANGENFSPIVSLVSTAAAENKIELPAEINRRGILFARIKSRKRVFAVGLLIPLLSVIGLGYWFFANRSSNASIESIAVLPFENTSNDANLDYLSDGLSESLIDRLAQSSQLKVIARSSSFKYRGENVDVQDVANKLGVQAIVMGRVMQRGDNLSIRVEMVDAHDNKQLWGEQYNRKAADALTIQQEIAQTVSEKLRLKLSGAQKQQIANQGTINPQAYELLLRGDFYRNNGGMENRKKAADYFEQAVAVDPNYALAYARLSRTYIILANASIVDPREFIPKAQARRERHWNWMRIWRTHILQWLIFIKMLGIGRLPKPNSNAPLN